MRGLGTSPGCAGWTRETEYMRGRGLPWDWLEKGNNTSECMSGQEGWLGSHWERKYSRDTQWIFVPTKTKDQTDWTV